MPVQPYFSMTLKRPWHWGIAVIGDSTAELPDLVDGNLVSVGRDVAVLAVRHAQDVNLERFEGDWEWATVTFQIRSLGEREPTSREILAEFDVVTPDQSIALGDADQWLRLATPGQETRVVISCDTRQSSRLEEVWIDLVPAG